ncbi:MAG: MmcQ/YjbR family DNA-binding protein [Cytophagales bacterium]|nr:MmcQ/YjbR family DNA-binding protein [Cytophagales bacterium]
MLSPTAVRIMALSLPEAEEQPHFEKPSFRVRKKIFATLQAANKKAVLKLSPVDQSVFTAYDQAVFYAVPGTWGKQGWTTVDLTKVKKAMFRDALTCAWRTVAPTTLAQKHQPKDPSQEL